MQQQIDELKAQILSLKEASTKSKWGDDQDNAEMTESKDEECNTPDASSTSTPNTRATKMGTVEVEVDKLQEHVEQGIKKKPPSRQNKEERSKSREDKNKNNEKQERKKKAIKQTTSKKSQEDANLTITEITDIKYNYQQKTYFIYVKFSNGDTSFNRHDVVLQDFKALNSMHVLTSYLKENNINLDKAPQKKSKKKKKEEKRPTGCFLDHDESKNYQDEDYALYFNEGNILYSCKCGISKKKIIPDPTKPVLVCIHSNRGCKWGYCIEHRCDGVTKKRKRTSD
jgi:hypothetical protein